MLQVMNSPLGRYAGLCDRRRVGRELQDAITINRGSRASSIRQLAFRLMVLLRRVMLSNHKLVLAPNASGTYAVRPCPRSAVLPSRRVVTKSGWRYCCQQYPDMLFQFRRTARLVRQLEVAISRSSRIPAWASILSSRAFVCPKVNGVIAFDAPGFVDAATTRGLTRRWPRRRPTCWLALTTCRAIRLWRRRLLRRLLRLSRLVLHRSNRHHFFWPSGYQTEQPAQPTRKRRNTAAPQQAAQQETAPFRPQPAPNGPPPNPAPFGVGQAVAPNAELEGALKSVFG